MKEEIILTPELEEAIKRSAVTDLLLLIDYAITEQFYDSDNLSLHEKLIDTVHNQADSLRARYKAERISK